MRRKNDRAAWTAAILGKPEKTKSKYNNKRTNSYASKHEAKVASDLQSLERAGNIKNLQEQVPIVLIEGRDGVRSIKYIADFVFHDPDGKEHIMDAKGMKTAVYKLKKKMLYLLHGKMIDEV